MVTDSFEATVQRQWSPWLSSLWWNRKGNLAPEIKSEMTSGLLGFRPVKFGGNSLSKSLNCQEIKAALNLNIKPVFFGGSELCPDGVPKLHKGQMRAICRVTVGPDAMPHSAPKLKGILKRPVMCGLIRRRLVAKILGNGLEFHSMTFEVSSRNQRCTYYRRVFLAICHPSLSLEY